MKIIRRKRTITIESCAFRRWQTEGMESSFSCPNCGKVFNQNPHLSAMDGLTADLIGGILAEGDISPSATATNDRPQPCGGVCSNKSGGNTNA